MPQRKKDHGGVSGIETGGRGTYRITVQKKKMKKYKLGFYEFMYTTFKQVELKVPVAQVLKKIEIA